MLMRLALGWTSGKEFPFLLLNEGERGAPLGLAREPWGTQLSHSFGAQLVPTNLGPGKQQVRASPGP